MTEKSFVCSSKDLKKIRELTGLTQDLFAREIGLAGASAISMIEKGRAKPSGPTWFAVKKRFGHLFEILDRNGIKYISPKPQPAPTAQDHGDETEGTNIPELDQEKLEDAVFNMLREILRSPNEKAKTEVLSFIIMWRDKIASEQ